MTVESVILRAYAKASQGKLAEAELLLRQKPESLTLVQGLDLRARILTAKGLKDEARIVWEDVLLRDPDNQSARLALDALSSDVPEHLQVEGGFSLKAKLLCSTCLAIMLGLAFSLGKGCSQGGRGGRVVAPDEGSAIEDIVVGARVNGKVLQGLSEGILTNCTDATFLVLSGGQGKDAIARNRNLAALALSVSEVCHIPIERIYTNPSDVDCQGYRLRIIPAWKDKKDHEK